MANSSPVPVTNLPVPAVLEMPPREEFGPALNERQRLFAWAFLNNSGNATRAAQFAGYAGGIENWRVTGHRLIHNEAVLQAIHEGAWRLLQSGSVAAIAALLEIVNDRGSKDRARAATAILERTGVLAETRHKIKVEKEYDEKEMIAICVKMAKELGVPASKLIGSLAPPEAIDAEFQEQSTVGIEDIV